VLEGRGADLVIFGSESTDARMSVVPAMVAERLGLPQLTFANKVEAPDDGTVKAHRLTDYGYDVVEASTPAVVSVVEKINEPRYPSFKGIMAAKKKPVETITLADAGIEPPRWASVLRGARSPSSPRAPPAPPAPSSPTRAMVARRSPTTCPSRSSSRENEEQQWLRSWYSSTTSTARSRRPPLELLTLAALAG
jgi:electron transfer flavoprotein alpha/beta subunit